MATDKKISQLSSGAPAQAGDEYVVARSGANYKLTLTNIAASMPPIGATTPNTGEFTSLTNGLGAVGTPSYTFTGDLNTGMWSPTADTVAWSTGGSERMRIGSSGNVGIGGTAGAENKVQILGTLPTSSNLSFGYFSNGTVPSGTTTLYAGFYSAGTTQATSFTLFDYQHFRVWQNGFGAGSTVTNQYGFLVSSNMTSATNNYGFYSDIASGSNRWNFYAAGTAANYFAGNVGIGATPTCKLLVFTGSTSDGVRIQRFAGNYYSELRQTDAQEGLAFLVGDGSTVSEKLRIKGTGQTRFKPRAGNPGGAEAGDVYYDSNDNKLKVYNGTSWVDLH